MSERDCVSFLRWALPRLGLRWAGYRRVHRQVCKRLARRLAELKLGDMAAYRAYLAAHPDEWRHVEEAGLIPISRFFRDRAVFERLGSEVLPELARRARAAGRPAIRCWSVGCASGEEPYSLAILWLMGPGRDFPDIALALLASDAAAHLIARARRGCYGLGSLRELPVPWREAAFAREGALYCVRPRFRDPVSFVHADFTKTRPPGPFDLVLCRNLAFTYFAEDRQREALDRLMAVTTEDGYLVIGAKERLPGEPGGLRALDGGPIYRRVNGASREAADG